MKTPTRLLRGLALAAAATLLSINQAPGATTVGVDPGAPWIGYMNVFELPANGGGYLYGSVWGTADLPATFSGATLTLGPNSIDNTDPYWYTPSGGPGAMGNKTMDANMYVETTGTLSGLDLTFTGLVLNNTLASPYTSVAFIKDFAPDYSSFNTVTVPLVNGVFSISLATDADPARHVQYGFETIGPDVWITDAAQYGTVQITAVPEPTSFVLAGLGLAALSASRRRQS